MAEWLRRLTRNQLGSARVGSNPTGVVKKSKVHPLLFYFEILPAPWSLI